MEDLSIHPRNWKTQPGFGPGTDNRKRNTSKPQNGRARKHDRKLAWLNARRNDYAVSTKSASKYVNRYRMPGSMNDGK